MVAVLWGCISNRFTRLTCLSGISLYYTEDFFLRMWLFQDWSYCVIWPLLALCLHGMGLDFWYCIKWLGHVVLLISMWYCRSFYKGNSCSHYSYSYVIIWYVRHLHRVQATGTFIHLTCQSIYFPLLSCPFFLVVKQPTPSKQGFPSNYIW